MKNYFSTLSTVSCFLLLQTVGVLGQAGTLDKSFGINGIVTTDYSKSNDRGNSVAVQPDGKILLGGQTGYDQAFALLRYEADGRLDASFGIGGKAVHGFPGGNCQNQFMVLQPDGKILMVGSAARPGEMPNFDFALMRFLDDGRLDQSFGTDGTVMTDFFGGNDFGYSVALQPDGKIIVVGATSNGLQSNFALARYEADGTLDMSFGTGGKVTTDVGGYGKGYSVVLQSDGKIIVAGFTSDDLHADFALARYEADGTLDKSFGTSGKVVTDFGGASRGYSVVLQSDGKIVVAGFGSLSQNSKINMALTRYEADGRLDESFGTGGKVLTNTENTASASSIILQPDEKIIVVGSVEIDARPTFNTLLVRYNADGSPDENFGVDGRVVTQNFVAGQFGLLEPNGKIVVAGYAYTSDPDELDFALARYLSGLNVGVLDFLQEQAATLVYPNPVRSEAALQYSLTKEEKITIGLYDMTGKLVRSLLAAERSAGEHREILQLGDIAPGSYLMTLSGGGKKVSVRIVKEQK